jgi:hypothetical protein
VKKAAPYIFLAVLLVITIVVVRLRNSGGTNDSKPTSSARKSSQEPAAGAVNRDRGFDRRTSFLEYTQHAICRMDCRHISRTEVQDIMREGSINYRKSNAKGRPCPTYAVEGYTDDNQHVRIVFAQCDNTTKVVTCIDIGKEWECHCPGDDNKYQNQER